VAEVGSATALFMVLALPILVLVVVFIVLALRAVFSNKD
jgi:hypothetical protein